MLSARSRQGSRDRDRWRRSRGPRGPRHRCRRPSIPAAGASRSLGSSLQRTITAAGSGAPSQYASLRSSSMSEPDRQAPRRNGPVPLASVRMAGWSPLAPSFDSSHAGVVDGQCRGGDLVRKATSAKHSRRPRCRRRPRGCASARRDRGRVGVRGGRLRARCVPGDRVGHRPRNGPRWAGRSGRRSARRATVAGARSAAGWSGCSPPRSGRRAGRGQARPRGRVSRTLSFVAGERRPWCRVVGRRGPNQLGLSARPVSRPRAMAHAAAVWRPRRGVAGTSGRVCSGACRRCGSPWPRSPRDSVSSTRTCDATTSC